MSDSIDQFLAERAAWIAAGRPADHAYLAAPTVGAPDGPARPARPLTGLVPDWTVDAVQAPAIRAMLDAAKDPRFG